MRRAVSQGTLCFPLYVRLRELEHHMLPKRLAPWVWKKLILRHQAVDETAPLLCLDALDEVRSGRAALVRVLQAFARESAARLFLTSRIIGYDQ